MPVAMGRIRREKQRMSEDNNKKFEYTIPLSPQDKPVESYSENMKALMYKEYMSRYLETLGVTPTKEAIAKVKSKIPFSKLNLTSQWKTQGSKADMIVLSPAVTLITLIALLTSLITT